MVSECLGIMVRCEDDLRDGGRKSLVHSLEGSVEGG
jgi:hypothetical protein